MKPLAAGNWKMNGLKASVSEINALKDRLGWHYTGVRRDDLPAGNLGYVAGGRC